MDKEVLVGDIGGTKSSFGVFRVKGKSISLVDLYSLETKKLNVYRIINEMLEKHKVKEACFAVAGPRTIKDYSKLTNLKFKINSKEILRRTSLKKVGIINDFEAIGYGINLLDRKDILIINKAKQIPKATKSVIGAGTGLGKVILNYDECIGCYVPIASEGGHSDFPVYDKKELELISSINRKPVSYEDILSGRGLVRIYNYLKNNKKQMTPEEISINRKKIKICRKAFEIFTKFYARAVKNFALETLALGGVYIAGGIAVKNPDIFKSSIFIKEFKENHKLKNILKDIPVYVILNQNIGLYGCVFCIGLK